MSFLSSMDISASGLTAQRLRMDIISQNIANIDTTHTESGDPYRRQYVVLKEMGSDSFDSYLDRAAESSSSSGGVEVSEIADDMTDFQLVYDPDNVDANEDGYVEKPNVELSTEMVDMISAYRSYEANVTAFNAYKNMAVKALELGS